MGLSWRVLISCSVQSIEGQEKKDREDRRWKMKCIIIVSMACFGIRVSCLSCTVFVR